MKKIKKMKYKFVKESDLGINFINTLNIQKIHSENKEIFVPYKDLSEVINGNDLYILNKFSDGLLGIKRKKINEDNLNEENNKFAYELNELSFFEKELSYNDYLYLYIIEINKVNYKFGFITNFSFNFRLDFNIYIKSKKLESICSIYKLNIGKLKEEIFNKLINYNKKLVNLIGLSIKFYKKFKNFIIVPIISDPFTNRFIIDYDYINNEINNEKETTIYYHKKYNKIYELVDELNEKSSFEEMIKKLCSNNNIFIKEQLNVSFKVNESINNLKNVPGTILDYIKGKYEHSCVPINALRNYLENVSKNNNITKIYYVKEINKIINDITIQSIHSKKNFKNKKKKIFYHKLYPKEDLLKFNITSNEIYEFIQIPCIFEYFKRFLYPYEFLKQIISIDFINNLDSENYMNFIYALTPSSCDLFFNYESLETLGDTILKFLISSEIFFSDKKNKRVGQLERKRVKYIKNDNLIEKANNIHLYKFILPKFCIDLNSENYFEINQKMQADIIESLIGAFYLNKNNLNNSILFLEKINLWEKFSQETKNKIKNISNFDYSYNKIIENGIPELDKQFIESLNLKIGNSFEEIKEYYSNHIDDKKEEDINKRYKNLEKVIEYNFKNKSLLETAMTPEKINIKNNYEKLEFLGDSIVELYIVLFVFKIFSPILFGHNKKMIEKLKLNEQLKYFKNSLITKIKSLLCANIFMNKISYCLSLPLYYKNYNDFEKFLSDKNIKLILERKLNENDNPNILRNKVISDLFESLVGAIYIDSDLNETFNFLHKIYSTFVINCIYHPNDFKYSIVNDFMDECNKKKIIPNFIEEYLEGNNFRVKIIVNDNILCEGDGKNLEEAKEKAAENGLKI